MSSVCQFMLRFASLILWKFSCFDRVMFKRYLSISRIGTGSVVARWAESAKKLPGQFMATRISGIVDGRAVVENAPSPVRLSNKVWVV